MVGWKRSWRGMWDSRGGWGLVSDSDSDSDSDSVVRHTGSGSDSGSVSVSESQTGTAAASAISGNRNASTSKFVSTRSPACNRPNTDARSPSRKELSTNSAVDSAPSSLAQRARAVWSWSREVNRVPARCSCSRAASPQLEQRPSKRSSSASRSLQPGHRSCRIQRSGSAAGGHSGSTCPTVRRPHSRQVDSAATPSREQGCWGS